LSRSPARELGRHYTPDELARRMVRESLDSLSTEIALETCRVLDPACGAGAFLLPAFDELCARTQASEANARTADSGMKNGHRQPDSGTRLEVVRRQIFGVDIDPAAVEQLRTALVERIGAKGPLADEARSAVNANIRCGNALTGAGFDECPPNGCAASANLPATRPAVLTNDLDFGQSFPEAAAAGGFDLIIGNPPYLRERNARQLFEQLAHTRLGRRWREARMDLWYYFAHRGLDLLRPGGTISFVVNSYWTASRGARRLIERLEGESRLELIELLGNQPVFAGVAGRHLVFRARKIAGPNDRRPIAEAETVQTSPARQRRELCRVIGVLPGAETNALDGPTGSSPAILHEYRVPHAELFHEGRLVLAPPDRLETVRDRTCPIGTLFMTRQGMAENPATINRKTQLKFAGRYTAGEGVFVLRADEIRKLDPTPPERALLRPYFDTVALRRYGLPVEPTHQVLYLTRATAPTLEGCPKIAAHLHRFLPILEQRRETRKGACAWWHLHWPRDESIFLEPRILSVQMGRRPQFVFAERPTFVGFSVNVILRGRADAPSLVALTGLLNSSLAVDWFERHAKRRGVHLEINGHVLRAFPVPQQDGRLDRTMAALVRRRQALPEADSAVPELEREIDRIAEEWYGVDRP
jgi:SAM-dependent methyltransferase